MARNSNQKSRTEGNLERKTGQDGKSKKAKKAEAGAAEGRKIEGFGTGSGTEPEPSEPAAAVSDSVPLRAGQTNPIKARNRSPSTSPVHEAQSDESTFCPMAENGLVTDRSQPPRDGPDRTRPESRNLRNGPQFQRWFELQLDHSRGTGQWREIKVRDSNRTPGAPQNASGLETG